LGYPLKLRQTTYRGRFAPSPTGPLHFGSLVAALASYLDARQANGQWLVRIEDVDSLRQVPGAASSILRSLEAHGFEWDEEVVYQSQHSGCYQQIVNALCEQGLAYPCPCSRRDLQRSNQQHLSHCRRPDLIGDSPHAIRFALAEQSVTFSDTIQGKKYYLLSSRDDFVLKRREGFYAYQLAVVADDYQQKITNVIRGIDLIDSTPLQLILWQSLGWNPPDFGHFPVVVDRTGSKLSKQRLSPSLDRRPVLDNLKKAAVALKLVQGCERLPDEPVEILGFLLGKWSRQRYRHLTRLTEPRLSSKPSA